jgi:hypothetical protein
VEAESNTSTVALRVVGGDEKELGHSVPGKYKYGDLALQVVGVTKQTVKYGHESRGTWT